MEVLLFSIVSVCVLLCVYHLAVYPAVISLLVKSVAKRPIHLGNESYFPTVSLVVPIHNEAEVIAAKITNIANMDYPREKLRVILAFDGCTDGSEETAARETKGGHFPNCQFTSFSPNIGKIAVLNNVIKDIASEVVALTDASATIDANALKKAAGYYSDPQVGVVCGRYHLLRPGSGGEQAYWNYQVRVKLAESRLAAPMGAHGAFYTFRRSLWSPLPGDTINDDFILPMRIVSDGFKAIYDPSIVASELEHASMRQDFRRRIRIGAGNMQQAIRMIGLANPSRGWVAFLFLSGKALRALFPLLLLTAFAAAALLIATLFGWMTMAATVLTGLLIIAVLFFAHPKFYPLITYFLSGNVAAAIGSVLYLSGQHKNLWKHSSRLK